MAPPERGRTGSTDLRPARQSDAPFERRLRRRSPPPGGGSAGAVGAPSDTRPLPERGRVLGIDVGYSERRPTTGLCVLAWEPRQVTWAVARARRDEVDRRAALRRLLGDDRSPVLAVGVDGPLRPSLVYATSYRCGDALLARGRFAKRGKPGQTSSGGGRRLHEEACRLVALMLAETTVAAACQPCAISDRAIGEAFPNLFLGVLCDDGDYPHRPRRARQWTDELYELRGRTTTMRRRIATLLRALTGPRSVAGSWDIADHDERAALVCALTALCLAARRFVAAGSPKDGWIILPPADHWGRGGRGERWAWRALQDNLVSVAADFPDAAVTRVGGGARPKHLAR